MPPDKESLRRQLTSIEHKTASAKALNTGGWWVGDVAGERQVRDDLAAGRLEWRAAWRSARSGLKVLDEDGDLDMADLYLREALWLCIGVLEKRVRQQDMAVLDRPSKKRGRPLGARSKKGRTATNPRK